MAKRFKNIAYTTGVWASVAAKAAVLSLLGYSVSEVKVEIPTGEEVTLPVIWAKKGRACVRKESSEAGDVTHGIYILAEAFICHKGLIIEAGDGIGVVTKPGLKLPVGEPAINPVPRFYLIKNVADVMIANRVDHGFRVVISVLDGEKIAKKTINEKLGILGGISILGTKGTVIPFNTKSFLDSVIAEIKFAKAQGFEELVFSPGRESLEIAKEIINLPQEAFIVIGDYILFSLLHAKRVGFKLVHIFSQPAKMAKMAFGFKNTHVKYGRVPLNWLADIFEEPEISKMNTVREVYEHVGLRWNLIEKLAEEKLSSMSGINVKVYTV